MTKWVIALLLLFLGNALFREAFFDFRGRWMMGMAGVALMCGAVAWMVWRNLLWRRARAARKAAPSAPSHAAAAPVQPTTPQVVRRPMPSQPSAPVLLPPDNLKGARAIMQANRSSQAWDLPDDLARAFLWVDVGDAQEYIAETWNRRARATTPVVHAYLGDPESDEAADTQQYTWRGGCVRWDIMYGREDTIIAVWALALLTSDEIGVRFCRDTWGSTNPAFALLTNGDWAALEAEYGGAAVATKFRAIQPDFTAETVWDTWLAQ